MAIGDTPDFVRRLLAALPRRWFPDVTPVLTGMLTGFAASWSSLYSLLAYTILQTRIATASGVFLDIIATDFFEGRINRNLSEPDSHFRLRILAEILRPRATRAAVAQALLDLTGVEPKIFEPANASDTGGYNFGGVGYNTAGGWGSLLLPFQAFITAYRPAGGGIAGVSGYGNIAAGIATTAGLGGYGVGAVEWADEDMVFGAITDADIYNTVSAAMPAATIGWTQGLAALPGQVQQVLLPISGFSRAVSTARAMANVVAGALMAGAGTSIATAKLFFNASTSGLIGLGVSAGYGRLVPQAGHLLGRGLGNAFGSAGALVGAGLMSVRGKSAGVGIGVMSGTLPLIARGLSRTFGTQLYGNVAAMTARGVAQIHGKSLSANAAALTGHAPGGGRGRAALGLVGGASLSGHGVGGGRGRLSNSTTASVVQARGKGEAWGVASLITQAAAPTAPSNLVASAATATSVTLSWTASVGFVGVADGSLVSDGGVLTLAPTTTGYPTSAAGLAAGALWSNGGVVTVVPGATPNPVAGAVLFNAVTAASLLALGGGNLPTTAPTAGSGQLWNSGGGEVLIA